MRIVYIYIYTHEEEQGDTLTAMASPKLKGFAVNIGCALVFSALLAGTFVSNNVVLKRWQNLGWSKITHITEDVDYAEDVVLILSDDGALVGIIGLVVLTLFVVMLPLGVLCIENRIGILINIVLYIYICF